MFCDVSRVKFQIIDNKYMFIVTIIAVVLFDTLSQLPAACLNKSNFNNRHLKDLRVSLSWIKFPKNCLSTQYPALLNWDTTFFNALTAISQSTSNLSA